MPPTKFWHAWKLEDQCLLAYIAYLKVRVLCVLICYCQGVEWLIARKLKDQCLLAYLMVRVLCVLWLSD
jgi:hypothetical protein